MLFRPINRIFIISGVLLALSACSSKITVKTPSVNDDVVRAEKLRSITLWKIQGRVSIVADNDGWSGTIRWKQIDEHFDIRIVGPLGQGSMHLQGSPGFVEFRSSKDKRSVTAVDAESLLYRQTGWRIPVSGLRFWVLGVSAPGDRQILKRNAQGLPEEFLQSGWKIRLLRYRKISGLMIPAKVFLYNDRFRVKIIVKQWKLES